MADNVIAMLDQHTSEIISDIIINPDSATPYDKSKSSLVTLWRVGRGSTQAPFARSGEDGW